MPETIKTGSMGHSAKDAREAQKREMNQGVPPGLPDDVTKVKQTESGSAQVNRGQEAGKDLEQGKTPEGHEPDQSPV